MTSYLIRSSLPLFSEALTCSCRVLRNGRFLSTTRCLNTENTGDNSGKDSSSSFSSEENNNNGYTVNKEFINRNPRNLEYMALARKREGWALQYPRKDFYHKTTEGILMKLGWDKVLKVPYRLHYKVSKSGITAWIEHSSGKPVVTASTKEWAIQQYLYSQVDVNAAKHLGRIFAVRCLQAGINCVFLDEDIFKENSEKDQAFLNSVKESDLELCEPEVIMPPYSPGIDYDGPNRYAEPKKMKEDYQIIE